jgi:hypothetical protein
VSKSQRSCLGLLQQVRRRCLFVIVTCVSDYRRRLDWLIGFIAPYTFTHFGNTDSYSAIAILRTLQFTVPQALGVSVFPSRIPAMDFTAVSLSLHITHEVFFGPPKFSFFALILRLPSQFSSKLMSPQAVFSNLTLFFSTTFLYSVSQSVRVRLTLRLAVYRQAPWDSRHSNLIFQLNTCRYSPYVTFSVTRGGICRLQLLLILASAVILMSKSHGIHDPILLSQIRDSPNLEGQVPVFISPGN